MKAMSASEMPNACPFLAWGRWGWGCCKNGMHAEQQRRPQLPASFRKEVGEVFLCEMFVVLFRSSQSNQHPQRGKAKGSHTGKQDVMSSPRTKTMEV